MADELNTITTQPTWEKVTEFHGETISTDEHVYRGVTQLMYTTTWNVKTTSSFTINNTINFNFISGMTWGELSGSIYNVGNSGSTTINNPISCQNNTVYYLGDKLFYSNSGVLSELTPDSVIQPNINYLTKSLKSLLTNSGILYIYNEGNYNVNDRFLPFNGAGVTNTRQILQLDGNKYINPVESTHNCFSTISTVSVVYSEFAPIIETIPPWLMNKTLIKNVIINLSAAVIVSTYKWFDGCNNLVTIYSNKDLSGSTVIYSTDMFNECTSLVGGNGTRYSSSKIDKTYARVDGGQGSEGYFTSLTTTPSN